MRYLFFTFLIALLVSNVCCNKAEESSKELLFSEAVMIATDYLITSNARYSYDGKFYNFLNDPNNDFWNEYVSNAPEILDAYGLKNKEYYAVIFYIDDAGMRDGGTTVFIDKKEKRVIGILYDPGRFEKNEAD